MNPSSKGATAFVLFSTGEYPIVTLKKPDEAIKTGGRRQCGDRSPPRVSESSRDRRGLARSSVDPRRAELWSRDVNSGRENQRPWPDTRLCGHGAVTPLTATVWGFHSGEESSRRGSSGAFSLTMILVSMQAG